MYDLVYAFFLLFFSLFRCDYDIAGVYPPMVADSEALKVLTEILDTLPGIGDYKVKLNHRLILDGMMSACGVPQDKLRAICSAIDKLDKESWETVKDEMCNTKGLAEEVADKLGYFVKIKGEPFTVLAQLRGEKDFSSNEQTKQGLNELEILFNYLQALGCIDRINFDLSLARGLDYYTGVIYEAAQTGPTKVGSIAAGGRYDNLVGMFSGKQVPAVGVSVGIERILAILEEAEMEKTGGKGIKKNSTQVLVGSIGDGLLSRKMQLSQQLWDLGVNTEYLYDLNPKPKKQLEYALQQQIPYVIWLAENELKDGDVLFKDLNTRAPDTKLKLSEAASTVAALIRKKNREEDEEAIAEALAKVQLKQNKQ